MTTEICCLWCDRILSNMDGVWVDGYDESYCFGQSHEPMEVESDES